MTEDLMTEILVKNIDITLHGRLLVIITQWAKSP